MADQLLFTQTTDGFDPVTFAFALSTHQTQCRDAVALLVWQLHLRSKG